MAQLLDIIINLDTYLEFITQTYGVWTYLILFLIIFSETGLVIFPFLPGDSLIFAAGAISALGTLNIGLLIVLLALAAILGNTVNFLVGFYFSRLLTGKSRFRFIKQEHLDRTHEFYQKHGGKAIILARFVPIFRTFVPFVAGLGRMNFLFFTLYNAVGAIAWILGFVLGGYFFGNIPAVQDNFFIVILLILIVSIAPAVIEFARYKVSTR